METFQYTITDEIGIHARPAGELAKLQRNSVEDHDKTETKQQMPKAHGGDGLGIRHGQTVTVETVGPDETEAAEAVQDFFQAKL